VKAAGPEIEAAHAGAQRDDVRALVRDLSAPLLSSSSATRTLQAWCDEHVIGTGPIKVLCVQWLGDGGTTAPPDGIVRPAKLLRVEIA
jgi:hypothetical protein